MRGFLWKVILILLLLGAGLVYWFYFNIYSEGERKGTLIKITKKGNVFKTVEGEMWLSCRQMMNAEKFYFSVVDEKLSDSLESLQDECVQLTYKQYRQTLMWRGDSKYIVTGFQRVNR
jgi:hypothetical protein